MNQDLLPFDLLASGFAHCRSVVATHGGLAASLLLAGLLGSLTHCVGMCGPFVLAQTVERLNRLPAAQMREFHRLAGGALVPYHLGRATTYALLGAGAAALAEGAIEFAGLRWISGALLGSAALFFLVYAGRELRGLILPPKASAKAPAERPHLDGPLRGEPRHWWSRTKSRLIRPLFDRPVGWRGYVLGVALGFLPCGLLWGALAAAAASGDALTGAFCMLAFALGTVPSLVAVGLAGHVAGHRFRVAALRLAPLLMLVNAATLSYLAWRTIA